MTGTVHFIYPSATEANATLCDCDISRDHDIGGTPVVNRAARATPTKMPTPSIFPLGDPEWAKAPDTELHTFTRPFTTKEGEPDFHEIGVPVAGGIVSISPEAFAWIIMMARLAGSGHKEGDITLRFKYDFFKLTLESLGYGEV